MAWITQRQKSSCKSIVKQMRTVYRGLKSVVTSHSPDEALKRRQSKPRPPQQYPGWAISMMGFGSEEMAWAMCRSFVAAEGASVS